MLVAFLMILPASSSGAAGGNSDNALLFDIGNGQTYWYGAEGQGTIREITESAAASLGIALTFGNNRLTSVSNVYENTISGQTDIVSTWKLYKWDGNDWIHQSSYDLSSSFSGCMAWALYPDAADGEVLKPTATPISRTVWTTFQGSSEAKGISGSYGPNNPALPVEWSRTYTTGYVNSGILVAGDLLYHTTGGMFGASGTDGDPWAYCLNKDTGEEVWKFHYAKGAGYEVATPVIVGDMILIPATSGKIYCLDRLSGTLLWDLYIPYEPPIVDGSYAWKGRSFVTGPTTLIYDSGALFFGSADGAVYCYSVDREGYTMIWKTVPAVGEGRGCFYFHAPSITTVGNERVLFIGNYEGYIIALKITDGSAFWSDNGNPVMGRSYIDLSGPGANTAEPGRPGSVGSIVVAADGMLLVPCSDSAMTSLIGHILGVKAADGSIEWKIDALMSSPVALDDGLIAYVSPSAKGAKKLENADGSLSEIKYAVYKFDYNGKALWSSKEYQWIKGPLVYAAGVVYGWDYSAGYYYPTGGCLTALDAHSGQELWRLLLKPFKMDSYSMCQPTVVDGKIYVANDYGAVYCLSGTAGPSVEGSDFKVLDTPGFRHWSWYALAAIILALIVLLVKFY